VFVCTVSGLFAGDPLLQSCSWSCNGIVEIEAHEFGTFLLETCTGDTRATMNLSHQGLGNVDRQAKFSIFSRHFVF
jgi:hypothetical protein